MRRPLSSLNPFFYHTIVFLRQTKRRFQWRNQNFSKERSIEPLKFRVKKHQSVLIRRLGDSDIRLQENKVENLKIALKKLNGIIIKPGETFSFCYLVGKATRKEGYLEGMMLSNGQAIEGIGGGLCQIANLIHWLVLHSSLEVTERHHHSFDPFPDSGRVVPFGSGATIFYNYIDYQFTNPTKETYQLLFWFDEKCINGDLRVNYNLDYKYHIEERNHRFLKINDKFYRENEIWREKYLKQGAAVLENVLFIKNFSKVMYIPEKYELENEEYLKGK